MVGFSVDGFRRLFGLPAPNYMKIDVDSIEERILAGAQETLSDPDLRSVLIELEAAETARNYRLTDALKSAGLYPRPGAMPAAKGDVVNGIFRAPLPVPPLRKRSQGRRQALKVRWRPPGSDRQRGGS